ncbi:WD repeat-containing protein 44-like isoform X2 [Asparagus officinalis]|nr:WD repeat-containing protein 44-like isoform X2 [Asparagus officinalis]XP_020248216.1 WD repeat-containing protein 44-like isoform X2 [Asparagus officinalis]
MTDNISIFQQQEEEDLFFDSREEISSLSDSCPESSSTSVKWIANDPRNNVWVSNPSSIQERRARFMRWMGLVSDPVESPCEGTSANSDIDRITSNGEAVLMRSGSECRSSTFSLLNEDSSTLEDGASEDGFEFRMKNLDDGSEFVVDEFSDGGTLRCHREVGLNRCLTVDEFNKSFRPSSFMQKLMLRDDNRSSDASKVRRKNGWLKRLGVVTCIADRQPAEVVSSLSGSDKSFSSRAQRVKVRSNRKRSKEFSAVFKGQEIKGHDGAILTMKFNSTGEYLASAGEDAVVRVWKVIECERREEGDIPEDDPSCVYIKVNYNSELAPLFVDREKPKARRMKRTSDSACIVVPPKEFRISDQPLHEFYGHDGDVLDLSWSKAKYLLSSSIDKTVRLWKVGCDSCLKVFVHNNYVTCIQFNPNDENYFISGSIDGKIRIWGIREHLVVDWTDIKDIITALCYRLDGKGIVAGSMTGDCRFFYASDHQLQLDTQVFLQSKKKSHDNRITGFQYCPCDQRKLLVTSAASQICILDGVNVVSKYKGIRNAGSQIAASFTSDGKHIISASEDSNVYIWNHADDHNSTTKNHVKSSRSYERFISNHSSVAIPWSRPASEISHENCSVSLANNTIYLSPAGSFTLSPEFLSEFHSRGSATWPEEKLPASSTVSTPILCRSQYKLLKTCCRNSSHSWGQVIVTGGRDGLIRSFQNYGLPVNP